MNIKHILRDLPYKVLKGSVDSEVKCVVYDSRKVTDGCLFVCIAGTARDAHDFIPEVIEKGTAAIFIDYDHIDFVNALLASGNDDITVIATPNTRKALAYAACEQFDHPAGKLTMIGITGTKGKTTISYMVRTILEKAGKKTGVIGTIGTVIDGELIKTANTTPESYELQRLLALMVEKGCTHCVMEVSSQGLKLDRVAGFSFDIGAFTNFSADHIGPGEHEDMDDYMYCKSLLFRQCTLGIINIDDPSHTGITKDHTCELISYGLENTATLTAISSELTKDGGALGISFTTKGSIEDTFRLPIPGRFNIYNALCAVSIGHAASIPTDTIKDALSGIHVKGRTEIVDIGKPFTVMIDYAHNEASIESLMSTVKEYNPNHIICIFGGGGNRPKMRRYALGEICGKMADLCIITEDNPRDEDISSINADIRVGLDKSDAKYIEIQDRKEGIWHALDIAEPGDLVLLIGKGHEEYQEIKGVKHHYSDRESVESYVGGRKTVKPLSF